MLDKEGRQRSLEKIQWDGVPDGYVRPVKVSSGDLSAGPGRVSQILGRASCDCMVEPWQPHKLDCAWLS